MSVSVEDPGVGEEPEAARGWGSLLRTNRPFSYLFLATAGSATGTYLAALALSIHVYDLTGSQKWIAGLLVADFLPIIVIGLTLGPLVDRLRRRRLLIVADLVRVAVFAVLPFVDSPAGIVALAAVGGVATGFFRPAVWAGLPNLVPERDRESATALFSTTENVAWILGPILAAFLTVSGNPDPAYWVNAVSFLVSALLIARIDSSALQSSDPLTRGHWRDVRDGLGLVLRSRPLRTVLFEEIRSRVQESDLSVPIGDGPWWYYSRTIEGAQYPVHARRPRQKGERRPEIDGEARVEGEQILLDGNAAASDHEFFSVGALTVSPDHRLLAALAPRVRPGGLLVYAVCTFTDEEGPSQIDAFIAAHPAFSIEEAPAAFAPLRAERGAVRTWPHRDDADAFYAVRLRRA